MWKVVDQQARIDLLLHVSHEQEASRPDLAEQHNGDVVDAAPTVRWHRRDLAADRPQHTQSDLIHGQAIACGQAESDRAVGSSEFPQPGRVARARAAHTGFEDARDVIALQEEGEPGDVILVRMREDHGIDPAIPWRDAAIECDQQPVGIRTAIHEESPAARALDEDGIALADVEDRHPCDRRGPDHDNGTCHGDTDEEGDDGGASRESPGLSMGTGVGVAAGRGASVVTGARGSGRARAGPGRRTGRLASSLPPANQRDEGHDRADRRDRIDGWFQHDGRKRQGRSGLHDGDEEPQDHPARCREHSPEHRWAPGDHDAPGDKREQAGGHRGRHERDDQQVDQRRQQRQAAERDQDDRQRCGLGGQ